MEQISFDDFRRIDIRLGKIIAVEDYPEARRPSYKLTVDFGPEIGVKQSAAQLTEAHTKDELMGMLVLGVVNFPPKRIGDFTSEVLILGFKSRDNESWTLATISKDAADLGSRLE